MNGRFKFETDDDGGWYMIPVELESEFSKLLTTGEHDLYSEFNSAFEQYRCDSPRNWTFEKPE